MIHKTKLPCPVCQALIEIVLTISPATRLDPPEFDAEVPTNCPGCGLEISDEEAENFIERAQDLL